MSFSLTDADRAFLDRPVDLDGLSIAREGKPSRVRTERTPGLEQEVPALGQLKLPVEPVEFGFQVSNRVTQMTGSVETFMGVLPTLSSDELRSIRLLVNSEKLLRREEEGSRTTSDLAGESNTLTKLAKRLVPGLYTSIRERINRSIRDLVVKIKRTVPGLLPEDSHKSFAYEPVLSFILSELRTLRNITVAIEILNSLIDISIMQWSLAGIGNYVRTITEDNGKSLPILDMDQNGLWSRMAPIAEVIRRGAHQDPQRLDRIRERLDMATTEAAEQLRAKIEGSVELSVMRDKYLAGHTRAGTDLCKDDQWADIMAGGEDDILSAGASASDLAIQRAEESARRVTRSMARESVGSVAPDTESISSQGHSEEDVEDDTHSEMSGTSSAISGDSLRSTRKRTAGLSLSDRVCFECHKKGIQSCKHGASPSGSQDTVTPGPAKKIKSSFRTKGKGVVDRKVTFDEPSEDTRSSSSQSPAKLRPKKNRD